MHILMKQSDKSWCELDKNVNNNTGKVIRRIFFIFKHVSLDQEQ